MVSINHAPLTLAQAGRFKRWAHQACLRSHFDRQGDDNLHNASRDYSFVLTFRLTFYPFYTVLITKLRELFNTYISFYY